MLCRTSLSTCVESTCIVWKKSTVYWGKYNFFHEFIKRSHHFIVLVGLCALAQDNDSKNWYITI